MRHNCQDRNIKKQDERQRGQNVFFYFLDLLFCKDFFHGSYLLRFFLIRFPGNAGRGVEPRRRLAARSGYEIEFFKRSWIQVFLSVTSTIAV